MWDLLYLLRHVVCKIIILAFLGGLEAMDQKKKKQKKQEEEKKQISAIFLSPLVLNIS